MPKEQKMRIKKLKAKVKTLTQRVFELTEFLVYRLGLEDVGAYYSHRVTYHPTCHSLRVLRVGDAPLRLLRAVRNAVLGALRAALRDVPREEQPEQVPDRKLETTGSLLRGRTRIRFIQASYQPEELFYGEEECSRRACGDARWSGSRANLWHCRRLTQRDHRLHSGERATALDSREASRDGRACRWRPVP